MRVYRRTDDGHRGRVYWIEYRRKGRRVRKSLRVRDYLTAERLARRHLDEVDARGVGMLTLERRTVRELLPLYEKELVKLGRAAEYVAKVLRRLERFLPLESGVAELAPEELSRALDTVPGGSKTVAHVFDSFRSFFNWAERMSYILRSPMARLVKGRVSRTREERRALTMKELAHLLELCDWRHGVFYLFLAFSGLRTIEARRVEWRDLDLARRVLTVRPEVAKGRKCSAIPLRADLVDWLKKWKPEAGPGARVFARSPKRETFYRDLDRAGIPRVTEAGRVDYHALRVTFVTLLGESGATKETAQALARHDTGAMTTMYTRFGAEHLRAAVDGIRGAVPCPESEPRPLVDTPEEDAA